MLKPIRVLPCTCMLISVSMVPGLIITWHRESRECEPCSLEILVKAMLLCYFTISYIQLNCFQRLRKLIKNLCLHIKYNYWIDLKSLWQQSRLFKSNCTLCHNASNSRLSQTRLKRRQSGNEGLTYA